MDPPYIYATRCAPLGVHVDLCVNQVDSLKTTALLARSAAVQPDLRPLALVLKSQLLLHRLHDTHSGGVGGYLLANMLRHLILHPPYVCERARRFAQLPGGGYAVRWGHA